MCHQFWANYVLLCVEVKRGNKTQIGKKYLFHCIMFLVTMVQLIYIIQDSVYPNLNVEFEIWFDES